MRTTESTLPPGPVSGPGISSLPEGVPAAAVEAGLRREIETRPDSPVPWRNLGVLLGACGRWEESVACLQQAAERSPKDASILVDQAVAVAVSGEIEEALAILRKAQRLAPRDREIPLRKARILSQAGRLGEARATCNRLVRQTPDDPAVLRLRAVVAARMGHYERALSDWTQATAGSRPRADLAFLAGLHWHCGDARESIEIGRQLLDSGPVDPGVHSGYVGARLHTADETIDSARAAVEEWGARHEVDFGAPPAFRIRRRRRRVRTGYVTQEFHAGPAIHFILPLLEQRDRERFEVYGYHVSPKHDEWSRRSARECDHWREAKDVQALARAVRKDELDVLVDLSGHYGCALVLMQERHAPVQMTFPNYPGSTGARSVDYILTDRWVCPPGAERQYTEKPLWMDSGYLPYRPPLTPRLTPPPHLANGYLTFGMLQRPSKWNCATWDAIAAILRQTPKSRLLIHYSTADLDEKQSMCRQRVCGEMEARGVSGRRLQFRGKASLQEHFEIVEGFDIALDTFPYAGQTTTCECLWMGVPVITLAGDLHAARVGWQIVDRAGAGEFGASDASDFVHKAVELAHQPARLLHYRRNLRRMMRNSPLLNGAVVRDIERAYRSVL